MMQNKKQKLFLKYDKNKWNEIFVDPKPTLQLFITNKCNKRCSGCFYQDYLDSNSEMNFTDYKTKIAEHPFIKKIILLGGEPTMHSELEKILNYNNEQNLKTTIYTNGFNLKKLENMNEEELKNIDLRIGVLGLKGHEKSLSEISTNLPATIVYMLRKNNLDQLLQTMEFAEKNFNCNNFYISSIRDIAVTKDFWADTKETISMEEYADFVQTSLDKYEGNIKRLHIARRGILTTDQIEKYAEIRSCRFLNIFPNNKKTICPLDISLNIKENIDEKFHGFYARPCNKNYECIMQKIVLEKK